MQAHGMSMTAAKEAAASVMNGLIQRNAFVAGMDDAFMVSTILTALTVILVLFYGSKRERAVRERHRKKPVRVEAEEPLLLE